MELIFGFDIGTTSIGFAAIEYDVGSECGKILRLGSRIFPEARDPDGTPTNQGRRSKRLVRRQLRRRKDRRKTLNLALTENGFLPEFSKDNESEWSQLMKTEALEFRTKGLSEKLEPYEFGRALYHLSQLRHFRGRDLEESDEGEALDTSTEAEASNDEKAAKSGREKTISHLKSTKETLSQYLSAIAPHEKKRGIHALRKHVEDEFNKLWEEQSKYHPKLNTPSFKAHFEDIIFAQKPVFWRLNTLGECRFVPKGALAPKGSWLSAQRRMLEKLNNLHIEDGNNPPLSETQRENVLKKLQNQHTMSWAKVREILGKEYKSIKFNLEKGGEKHLLGNPVEAKLSSIFGDDWVNHSLKDEIRNALHKRFFSADYGQIGQRIVISRKKERDEARIKAAQSFADDFGANNEQVVKLRELTFPTGWDAFSIEAIEKFLPQLESGVKLGDLMSKAEYHDWRNETFPNREEPTGEYKDKLPSPRDKEEQDRIKKLRNPTVVRTQNELRKVVNNLIAFCGRKPDLIRIELARDVGMGKREREEVGKAMRKQEGARKKAIEDLQSKNIAEPSHRDIEKWLLWKESSERCPYTGDQIGFHQLFVSGEFDIEHIWPRSRSLDDSFRNKTLCRKDINIAKGNQTPFEYYSGRSEDWDALKLRLRGLEENKAGVGIKRGKVKRFLSEALDDGFASRQLNDTGYAGRQAVESLKRLWPDLGPTAPVNVQVVNGKVTAHLRRLWQMNHILGDTGEKNRADHRHHAIDALVVACAHGGMTQKLSRYWQTKDDPRKAALEKPQLLPPWANIRNDAKAASDAIIVSHRVRKKVSGPLHKETVYGDTGEDVLTKSGTYRQFVRRKSVKVLTKGEYEDIRDPEVRKILQEYLDANGGDPKKLSWENYPRLKTKDGSLGPEIKSVRILIKQQISLMAEVSTGYADLGNNHHIAIYKNAKGKAEFEVVSLFEAMKRLSRQQPVVKRHRENCTFVMSLSAGDSIEFSAGDKKGIWVVTGIWSSGVTVLNLNTDAQSNNWLPRGKLIPDLGGKKISIDPIGRVHPAND